MAPQVFKTQYNSEPSFGYVQKSPSETVPDESLTPLQILRKYALGLETDVVVRDEEDDELTYEDLSDLVPNANENDYYEEDSENFENGRLLSRRNLQDPEARRQQKVTPQSPQSSAEVPAAPAKES